MELNSAPGTPFEVASGGSSTSTARALGDRFEMAEDKNQKVGLGSRVFSGLVAISIWEMGKVLYRARREEDLSELDQDKIDEDEDE